MPGSAPTILETLRSPLFLREAGFERSARWLGVPKAYVPVALLAVPPLLAPVAAIVTNETVSLGMFMVGAMTAVACVPLAFLSATLAGLRIGAVFSPPERLRELRLLPYRPEEIVCALVLSRAVLPGVLLLLALEGTIFLIVGIALHRPDALASHQLERGGPFVALALTLPAFQFLIVARWKLAKGWALGVQFGAMLRFLFMLLLPCFLIATAVGFWGMNTQTRGNPFAVLSLLLPFAWCLWRLAAEWRHLPDRAEEFLDRMCGGA